MQVAILGKHSREWREAVSGQEDGRTELRIKSESQAGLDSCSR